MTAATVTNQAGQGDALTFDDFKRWLQARQAAATAAVTASTGDAFSKHCAALIETTDAWRAVALFEREGRA